MATRAPLSTQRKVLFSFVSFLLFLALIVVIGEMVMRKDTKPLGSPYDNHKEDAILGWKVKEGYTYSNSHAHDLLGNEFVQDVSFQKHGFRKWNDKPKHSTGPVIFFIGDSYTESLECGDNDLFYVRMRDSLNATVYACGVAGFGTVQQWMILNQFIDSVNPDYVVLQMCNNDFCDNYWMTERHTVYNVKHIRPYLNEDKTLDYHFSSNWAEWVNSYSLFLGLLSKNLLTLLPDNALSKPGNVEEMIPEDSPRHKYLQESFRRTEFALQLIQQTVTEHKAKLIVFDADHFQPGEYWFPEACKRNNIDYVSRAGTYIFEKERQKEPVRAWDGYHWAPRGEQLIADTLISFLKTRLIQ